MVGTILPVYAFLAAAAGLIVSGLVGLYVPRPLQRSEPLVLGMAGAFALGGLIAQPAATGLGFPDAVLRASLCAVTVVVVAWDGSLSRRRRVLRRWMIVAAAAVAVLGAGASSAWLAGAGFGLALGAASARLNSPALRALSAGLTAQAALRLERPSMALATAVVAAAVFALLIAGGVTGLRRQARRRWVRVGLAATGLAAVMSALGVWSAYRAHPEVVDGIAQATSALAQARGGDVAGSAGLFDQGAESFGGASGQLASWWARPAMVVPVVGRHSRTMLAMARSGSALSAAGSRAVREGEINQIRLANGAVSLERITALQAPAREALSSLSEAEERLAKVRSPLLVSPVSSRLEVLSANVSRARRDVGVAAAASEVIPALLGGEGPRRYFVAMQTPSELRASGGFIGNFGEISAREGRLSLDRVGRTNELNLGVDPKARRLPLPPDYTVRYGPFSIQQHPHNLGFSPDFPTVARALASLPSQSGGRPYDGVVAMDPIALAGLLKVVVPVQVAPWPVPITADNAAQVLLFEEYVRFRGNDRIDFLSRVVEAVWQRVVTATPSFVELVRAMGPLVDQKHLQLASMHGDEQRTFSQLGLTGAMAPVNGDFLGVVTQNFGGNKIDWFLRRSVDYHARLDPTSGRIRSTVRITLRNLAPASGLPDFVIGNAATPPLPKGSNKLYLSVYTPWRLSGARVDGRSAPIEAGGERRRRVYSAFLTIPPGGSTTVELELGGQLETRGAYRLDLHRQPFLAPDSVTTSLEVPEDWQLDEGRDRRQTTALQLVTDEAVTVNLARR